MLLLCNIGEAIYIINYVGVLKQVLIDAHSDVDHQFHSIFENTSGCADKCNVPIAIPESYMLETNSS